MAKGKKTKLKWLWIIIPIVIVVLFASYNLSKNNLPQSQQSSTEYQVYQDPMYGFSIEYPKAWEVRNDTQVFENGDAVAFRKTGKTQKPQTELTDGGQVVISKPFKISSDLKTWTGWYFDRYAERSQNTLNGRSFEKIYDCPGPGCMTYYYTLVDGQVFGVATFAQGKDKMVYENAIDHMLQSLILTGATNGSLSKDDAIATVKALTEVVDYLKRIPNGLVAVNGDEDNSYLVQVYEIKDGHTATFNWYKVDKTTGEVTAQ